MEYVKIRVACPLCDKDTIALLPNEGSQRVNEPTVVCSVCGKGFVFRLRMAYRPLGIVHGPGEVAPTERAFATGREPTLDRGSVSRGWRASVVGTALLMYGVVFLCFSLDIDAGWKALVPLLTLIAFSIGSGLIARRLGRRPYLWALLPVLTYGLALLLLATLKDNGPGRVKRSERAFATGRELTDIYLQGATPTTSEAIRKKYGYTQELAHNIVKAAAVAREKTALRPQAFLGMAILELKRLGADVRDLPQQVEVLVDMLD